MSDAEARIICKELGFSWDHLAEQGAAPGEPGKQDFRRAIEALNRFRQTSADQERTHMLSELSNLAHGGDGSHGLG